MLVWGIVKQETKMEINKIKNSGFIQHHFLLIKNSFKGLFGVTNGYFYNDFQSVKSQFKEIYPAPLSSTENVHKSLIDTTGFGVAQSKLMKSGAGFTLIELMVVVAIMVMLSSVMVLNISGQRAPRDLKIAENELVSNIRKIQSYTLSRRALPSGNIADYYLMKFDLNNPTQYTVQALYNTNSTPHYLENVETINFPPNIRIAPVLNNPITIRRQQAPNIQNPQNCALAAFAAPFGKVILNDGCNQAAWVANNSGNNSTSDDYEKIIEFNSNIDCAIGNSNPPTCTRSADSVMTITLTTNDGALTKTVTVNGITGAITFN